MIALPDVEEPRKRGFFARLFGRDAPARTEITSEPLDATAPLPDAPATPATPRRARDDAVADSRNHTRRTVSQFSGSALRANWHFQR